MSLWKSRSCSSSSNTVLCHAIIDGSPLTVPCNWIITSLLGTKFMMSRSTFFPDGSVEDFSTPNKPFKIGFPLTVATSSNGTHLQIFLFTNSSAKGFRSSGLTWILPGGLMVPNSLTSFRHFSGWRRKSFVCTLTQANVSIDPPCSGGGKDGRTCSKVIIWQVPISSPEYPMRLDLRSFSIAPRSALVTPSTVHLRSTDLCSIPTARSSMAVQGPGSMAALGSAILLQPWITNKAQASSPHFIANSCVKQSSKSISNKNKRSLSKDPSLIGKSEALFRLEKDLVSAAFKLKNIWRK